MAIKDSIYNSNSELEQQHVEPYIGPRPFRIDIKDQLRFFGRNAETDEIIALITSNRITLVYAQSGVGKTSIFNAKIIPSLRDYGFEVLPIARVKNTSTISPNDNNNNISSKIENFYIYNAFQILLPEIDPLSILDLSLFEFLDRYFPAHKDENGETIKQVLVFDQLEELFSFYPDKWIQQQKNFFEQIVDSLENNPFLRIVFVIREDFLGQLDPFRHILPEKLRAHFRLEPLRRKQAILAIKGPLTNIIKTFNENEKKNIDKEVNELVNDLLKIYVEIPGGGGIRQLEGQFVEPIQLQVVCKRWWRERNTTKKPNLEDLGNVNKALEDFYDEAIVKTSIQTGVNEKEIRLWCETKLTTSSGTRALIHRGQNDTAGIDNNVVDSLESKYLIRREWRSGASWYELTHDRLIKPIKDSNKEWFDKEQKSKTASAAIDFENIALDLQNKGDAKKAFSYYNKSLTIYKEMNHKKGLAHIYNRIGILLKNNERYDDALANHQKALDIHLNIKDQLNIAKDYANIASIFEKKSEYDQAVKLYDEAIKIDRENIEVYYNKGKVLEKLKRFEEAIKCYDQVIRIDPENVDAFNEKGDILYYQGKYEEAIEIFNKLLVIILYNKKCIPFIGSTVCNPWIPFDQDIAIKWAREYNYPLEDSYQLSRVAQFLAIEYDDSFTKEKLKNELERIKPPDFSLDQFRNTSLAFLADLKLPIYITTNYDHFIEEALKSRGREPISDFCRWNEDLVEYANDYEINSNLYGKDGRSQISSATPLVYHLHGDIDHPLSMVLTEKDFIDFNTFILKENETKIIPLFLRQALSESSLLLFGYDSDDLNFRSIFHSGLISFMFSFTRNKNSFAIIQMSGNNYVSKVDVGKVKNYIEKYAAIVFKMRINWGNIHEFIDELRKSLDKK